MKTLKNIYTGKIYADDEVLTDAPHNNKTEGALHFFNVGKYISDDELEKEYETRGLVPADVFELAEWSEKNKEEDRYFATHWKDSKGKWCFAAFNLWDDERKVSVYRSDNEWCVSWWFAGVRKSVLSPHDTSNSLDTLPLELLFAISTVKDAGYLVFKQL